MADAGSGVSVQSEGRSEAAARAGVVGDPGPQSPAGILRILPCFLAQTTFVEQHIAAPRCEGKGCGQYKRLHKVGLTASFLGLLKNGAGL